MMPTMNHVGDRIAVTTQGIMERMGVRENEIDSPAVVDNYRVWDLIYSCSTCGVLMFNICILENRITWRFCERNQKENG